MDSEAELNHPFYILGGSFGGVGLYFYVSHLFHIVITIYTQFILNVCNTGN